MIKKSVFILLAFLGTTITFIPKVLAQSKCTVLLESISGTYEGDCKKGKAHGNGKAIGTDTYAGAFKKGQPDGFGIYTWANGNIYSGEWKKGKKEGKGELVFAEGANKEKMVGYWSDDEYIGTEKYPYKLMSNSSKVTKVNFKRLGGEENKIIVYLNVLQKSEGSPKFNVQVTEGQFGRVQTLSRSGEILNVSYPFRGRISFTGSGAKGEFADIRITQTGTWEVTVNVN